MFESVLKGTKVKGKVKGRKTFGGGDANRWKREGSVQSMLRLKKGNWGNEGSKVRIYKPTGERRAELAHAQKVSRKTGVGLM